MEWLFGTTIIYYSFNGEDFFPQGNSKYSVVKEGSVYTLTVNDLRMTDGALPYICKPEALKPEQASLTVLGKSLKQITYSRVTPVGRTWLKGEVTTM